MGREFIDLYELQSRLKEGVERLFPSKVWLKAEISAVKVKAGGHCYMELSQTGDSGIVAKAQAVVWASRYRFIAPYFESVTGSPLKEGLSVLIQVQVSFSQLYGLSLVINDIDPDFSLGENERQRLLTLERLRSEGLMDMQKTLGISSLPYRIAVISAPDAAGYRDFMRHLHENQEGFVFHTDLFPALMQGGDSPLSIISAMDEVAGSEDPYDILLILRGGGARLDLACYDDYMLASHIAQFPLPVFTAVGHDQDVHVCDLVAFSAVKTPTALADEIVQMYADEDAMLLNYAGRLRMAFSGKIYRMEGRLQALAMKISGALSLKMAALEGRLAVLEARLGASDPRKILGKGYVLALDGDGRVLRGSSSVSEGDRISVLMKDGRLHCTVDSVSAVPANDDRKNEVYGKQV